MSEFNRLHPSVQHHIVNSLQWQSLRPLQEAAVGPIMDGQHVLVLAPTAGGKTEAVFFPLLSRMIDQGWSGLSVLYVCPLRALLNNLHIRLANYCSYVGRSCGLWHGDVRTSARRRILAELPDCLLTTPESLEVILVSQRDELPRLFGGLRAAVVDEIHAFAGDDRGWHLLSVLERISKIAGRPLQRVGLSATVGNPQELIGWLTGSAPGERIVIAQEAGIPHEPDVQLDYVGSLENAALVISRMHRGQKRLVFCDSRSRAESLAAGLRLRGVDTYVSHSSLSREERLKAEEAFAEGDNCVIVATSTLELGIDVGDLDRVIQIDAPTRVASFLQRLGRSGRRQRARRNCLFLATSQSSLLQAAGLLALWESGFVEPVSPPALPFHIFAQQVMALALQQGGIGRELWREWIGGMPAFSVMPRQDASEIIDYMLRTGILSDDHGILWLGAEGEREFGRRNFMELFSVFTSPPLFSVRHGRMEIGHLDEISLVARGPRQPVVLLGGRSWAVTEIDWSKRIAYAQPSQEAGKSRWCGPGRALSFRLCQAMKGILVSQQTSARWSRRTCNELASLRQSFAWLSADGTTMVREDDGLCRWWTFGGMLANAAIFQALVSGDASGASYDDLAVVMPASAGVGVAGESVRELQPSALPATLFDEAIDGLKFASCIPAETAARMLQIRLSDPAAVERVISQPIAFATAR